MMDRKQKSDLLAERLMGWHKDTEYSDYVVRWIDADDWWLYVAQGFDPDIPLWAPFEDIAQAEQVLMAMDRRGIVVDITVRKGTYTVTMGRPFPQLDVWHDASATTLSEAICNAAGRALKLWD
jgi:hypothetical protein